LFVGGHLDHVLKVEEVAQGLFLVRGAHPLLPAVLLCTTTSHHQPPPKQAIERETGRLVGWLVGWIAEREREMERTRRSAAVTPEVSDRAMKR
jgi:hypothetical protein